MIRRSLPSGWRWVAFGDVATIASNLVDPTATPDATHIAPNHIESWTGRLLGRGTVASDGVTSGKHRFRTGQILYSKIRPYLAKATLVDFDGVCSADMYPIDVRAGLIDPTFLLRWMLTPEFTEAASGRQGRTVLPKINQAALVELPVPLPPLDQQRAIALHLEACLSRSRSARRALDEVPALVERLRKSILAAAFRGDLTADWRNANPDVEPASELLARIRIERRRRWEEAELAKMLAKGKPPKDDRWKSKYVEPEPVDDSDLPELPELWCWASLHELSELRDGSPIRQGWSPLCVARAKRNDEWGIIKTTAVQMGAFDPAENKALPTHLEPRPELEISRGDLLVTRAGPRPRVGIVALVRSAGARLLLCDKVYSLRFNSDGVNAGYVESMLNAPLSASKIEDMKTGSSENGMNLTQSKLLSLPVPLAPRREQDRVQELLELSLAVSGTMNPRLSTAIAQLRTMESALLAQAFGNELLPGHPNEPTSQARGNLHVERGRAPAAGR